MSDTSAAGSPPIFVRVEEAARILAIEEHTLRQLCKDGVIASAKAGRRRLVSLESVREYAAALLAEAESA